MASWEPPTRPPGPPPDSKVEKWKRWIETPIQAEVVGMHHRRNVYRTVARIVNEHGQLPPSLFFRYLQDTYVPTQAVAVRRQAETRADVVSLGRLLREIETEPQRLSRARFLSLYEVDDETHANRVFDTQFAGMAGSDHLDTAVVSADLAALASAAHGIRRYVNRHLAHTSTKPLRQLPTFEELNRAVDTVGDVFRTYARLLAATSWPTLVPVPQYDWLAVFREPWIR